MKKSPLEKNNVPGLLKFGVYASEVIINAALFYLLYAEQLSPGSRSIFTMSTLFGYMLMTLIVAYSLGVFVRPLSFYYRSDRRGRIVANVVVSLAIEATCFLLLMMVQKKIELLGQWRIVMLFASLFIVLIFWRLLCRSIIRFLRSFGRNTHQVIFVGANETLTELFLEMKSPYYGYQIVGYFNDEPIIDAPAGFDYLGKVGDAPVYLKTHPSIRHLYCGLPSHRTAEVTAIVDVCDRTCVHFFSVPEVRNYLKRRVQLELIGSVPVLGLREDPLLLLRNRIIKRGFDLILSLLFMVPFWLIIFPLVAVCTKIFQPGPVFFKQRRNGINGIEFDCLKFRSMKVDNDAESRQATKDDPRITKFGRFLRRTSIDELPQFINVLKGDMSIVGPRPHMVAHTEAYSRLISKYMVRHWVRPGITGWAQVNGSRGETRELIQMEERIRKDIWYIENWSLSLDIQILFLTIWKTLKGDSQAY